MGHTAEFNTFLDLHRDQLIASGVPDMYWQALYQKLKRQAFDSGNVFQLLKVENDEDAEYYQSWALRAIKDIRKADPENIFLVDHAWTYEIKDAKKHLLQNDNLRGRLCNMLNVERSLPTDVIVEKLFNAMWKVNNFYSIANAQQVEQRLPIWYVMDELGTAVTHSDTPNCRIVPFFYLNDSSTYSLLFPIEDIEDEDFICRNFAENDVDREKRSGVLLPWVPKIFEDVCVVPPIPDAEYFLKGHIEESLPDVTKLNGKRQRKEVMNVFSQYDLVETYLASNDFEIVTTEEEADILWYTKHFKDFETLSATPQKYVNQFPFEYVLTLKDLLAITCRRSDKSLRWIPQTFNLVTELCNFISCYQQREAQGLDNYWIAKPYNLARSLDIYITNNIDFLVRLASTGPKIVQKYVTRPVLFYRPESNGKVKFDVRYVLLLKSVRPLEAYVHPKFFLRFANKAFELNDFEDYEKHFTVMNYKENFNLRHIKCEDFLVEFDRQYPKHPWQSIEKSILTMLRDVLESATSVDPPCGIAISPQSRALYAADLMLQWNDNEMEPTILEINFAPDCKRACDYYPDFYDDIFSLLFLDKDSDKFLKL